MSSPERAPHHERHEEPPLSPERELPAPEQAEPLRKGEKDPAKQLEQARNTAEQSANPADKNPLEELEKAEAAGNETDYSYTSHELEDNTSRLGLQRLRRQETRSERTLSRVIHQPVVRVVSEAAGKTVSRPSGLLGGGVVALMGTTGYLFLAKGIGFNYNYLVFLLLFVGGFIVGIALEMLVWLATRHRHHKS